MNLNHETRLVLPGKGALESATMTFLAECGMKVQRSNPRQYLARMSSIPDLEVVFQRAADIPFLVQDGDATLGITGYDILAEHRGSGDEEGEEDDFDDDLMVLSRDLGYGACRLVVAVPETWIDVSSCADLWHLASYYATHKRRGLRVATKYPQLAAQFLRRHGITDCKIISPHGALEAAPLTDTADLIVDLTETGTTLRENSLKLLDDGIVLSSQACLIGNGHLLRSSERALGIVVLMLELIEARMQAQNRSILTASLQIESTEEMQQLCARLHSRFPSLVSGLEFHANGEGQSEFGNAGYTLSGVVHVKGPAASLLEIVALLREKGAVQISITPLTYRFREEAVSVRGLRERLRRSR